MSSTYGSSAMNPRAIWMGVRARSAASPQACTTSCSLLEAAWSPYCCAQSTQLLKSCSPVAQLCRPQVLRQRAQRYRDLTVLFDGQYQTVSRSKDRAASCVSTSVRRPRTQRCSSLSGTYLTLHERSACAHCNSDHN